MRLLESKMQKRTNDTSDDETESCKPPFSSVETVAFAEDEWECLVQ